MTWFKVDDGLWGHPKWLATPASARGLWVTAGSWSAANLTDGRIPRHVLSSLGGRSRDAAALVAAGLWVEHADGWSFHEWNDSGRQPTKESILAEREAAAQRQRRAREKAVSQEKSRRDSRRDKPVDNYVAEPDGDRISTESSQTRARLEPDTVEKRSDLRLVDNDLTSGDDEMSRRDFAGSHGPPGPARPDPYQNHLLTLISRLAVGDARNAPPAEVIDSWQEIAGPGIDLNAEAAAYFARFGDAPPQNERGAWLGWLRKAAGIEADRHAFAQLDPDADIQRPTGCGWDGCMDGYLGVDDQERPVPCPRCRPHLRAVEAS